MPIALPPRAETCAHGLIQLGLLARSQHHPCAVIRKHFGKLQTKAARAPVIRAVWPDKSNMSVISLSPSPGILDPVKSCGAPRIQFNAEQTLSTGNETAMAASDFHVAEASICSAIVPVTARAMPSRACTEDNPVRDDSRADERTTR